MYQQLCEARIPHEVIIHIMMTFIPNNDGVEIQQHGRSGRQEDPGSSQFFLSLEVGTDKSHVHMPSFSHCTVKPKVFFLALLIFVPTQLIENFTMFCCLCAILLAGYSAPVGQQQPTLSLLGFLLNFVTTALENASKEKSLLLNKDLRWNILTRETVIRFVDIVGLSSGMKRGAQCTRGSI
ncbi:hypothetical protein Tco_1237564 [Tanacetum coccineum]